MEIISGQSARIAILGGGGMGKTSLARAVLHHPETVARFEHRFPC
jgi:GTPase SAR1 family protein